MRGRGVADLRRLEYNSRREPCFTFGKSSSRSDAGDGLNSRGDSRSSRGNGLVRRLRGSDDIGGSSGCSRHCRLLGGGLASSSCVLVRHSRICWLNSSLRDSSWCAGRFIALCRFRDRDIGCG